ncbi:nuclear transport factor 2 family protein [Nocardia sp. 2]|uniref:Nuclear transport factor 2 family protein n=1 Tax=Nocardia acididurans TaxID=2802282 RepID=A0ABS1MH08_9NOCA|nr:nuclear transport factor 2 family protein [Nocardia acididurans]MBL1079551.1 nuclear transport factor 2 family protein [Nocardia acididurans]
MNAPVTAARDQVADALHRYFDGLYHSDTTLLSEVFHPKAIYATATDGTLTHLTMAEYFPIVAARPAPAARNAPRRDRILSIDFAGPVTALARVECALAPKHFTDLLTLVHLENRWQIIAKVFHYDLEQD